MVRSSLGVDQHARVHVPTLTNGRLVVNCKGCREFNELTRRGFLDDVFGGRLRAASREKQRGGIPRVDMALTAVHPENETTVSMA